jgi:hypothetical protein
MMKKIFLFSLAFLVCLIPLEVFAQGFVPLAPIPGLTGEGTVSTTAGLPSFFNNLYKFLIGLAAVAAVIQIIRSGIELAMNKGSVSEIISAKGRVAQALWGLVLVLTPALVFGLINPNILNLSVTLPDITFTDRGTPSDQRVGTTTSGSTIAVSGSNLKTATFSSPEENRIKSDASTWLSNACGGNIWAAVVNDSFCPGGYDAAGKCALFKIIAQCAFKSESPITFVDITTKDVQWRPTSPEPFAAFETSCSQSGGQPCVLKNGYRGAPTIQKLSQCSGFSGFTIPDGAPNAKNGGNCYQTHVACSPPDRVNLLCEPGKSISR